MSHHGSWPKRRGRRPARSRAAHRERSADHAADHCVGSRHGHRCCRARPRSPSTPRRGVRRHPHHAVGQVGRPRPAASPSRGHRSSVTSRHRRRGRSYGGRRSTSATAAGRCRAGASRRPAGGRRRSAASRWRARTSPSAASAVAARRGTCRAGGARRRPRARALISARDLGDGAEAERAPWPTLSSSAMPARTRRSGSEPGLLEHRLERARRGPPRLTKRAGLLGDRGDREDHVGGAGHVGLAELEADDEAARPRARRGRGRVGRSAGSTPPTTSPPRLAARERGEDRVGVAAGGSGRCRRPTRWRRRRGRRRRRPDGRRAAGWAGSRPRPHRGHRRGAGPRRAGRRWCGASSAAAVRAPGTVASRSPTRITPPASRPSSPCVGQRARAPPASSPGAVGTAAAASCARPRGGERRERDDRVRAVPDGLAQPQEDRRRPRPRARGPTRTTVEASRGRRSRRRPWRSATARGQEVRPPRPSAAGRGSRCRWCRARRARTWRRRRRPRR